MNRITLLHPLAPVLLLVIPCVYWLFRWADRKRADAIRKFSPLQPWRARGSGARFAILAALGLTALAIAQPVWRESEAMKPAAGLDVVFLLDVSRSMLTRDGAHSRLEQARAAIDDVVSHSADERLALVAFAGDSSVECPLTNDYEFLRGQLKTTSRDSVSLGGSRSGDAIRFAARTAFDDASRSARELVLLSDGGDDGSSPDAAASELAKRNIRLVVAGVGNATVAGLVPKSEADPSPYLFGGKPVMTKREDVALQRVCRASVNCVYTTLPGDALEKTVLDRKRRQNNSDMDGTQMGAALFALLAALVLAGECVPRGRREG